MEFIKVCEYVLSKLKELSLEEKTIIFSNYFKCPISYRDGVFYYRGNESTLTEVSDYLSIKTHWLTVSEFDRLSEYFKNKEARDK